jgi:uncharacterized protein (DUF362 family)
MALKSRSRSWSRRSFLRMSAAGLSAVLAPPFRRLAGQDARPVGPGAVVAPGSTSSGLFWIDEMPDQPFTDAANPNRHVGFEALLSLMGPNGLKFYRSEQRGPLQGPLGLVAPDDVVLIKVNAQWKYRGCTSSDLVRGIVQRVLDHPDGFRGEVVIVENGQGRGSLACDTFQSYHGDRAVHANANDERHSFLYLVETLFRDPRVSAKLLDPIRDTFLAADDHDRDGYRKMGLVSYPCFTTAGGRRVELKEGVWTGSGHASNLKLINVPVLKHHDKNGSEITASLKHFYGLVSMQDGNRSFRHYARLGETTGTMIARVRAPSLNVIDATWVSFRSITGTPAETTFRANQILASQDPVALDYWAAKNILYPIDNDERHHPDFPGIDAWLTQARDTINAAGGLADIEAGIFQTTVTKDESRMSVFSDSAARYVADGPLPPPTPSSETARGGRPGGSVLW